MKEPELTQHEGQPNHRRRPHAADVLWLSFLALYLSPWPWITVAPPPSNWTAPLAGTLLFLVIYAHSYRVAPHRLIPHALATAAIGFSLAGFGGVWNVFIVLAASIAARLQPRRTAFLMVGLLILLLVSYGLWMRLLPVVWGSGVYFAILAAGTTMLVVDLESRNWELRSAQDEIRRLSVTAERERIAHDLHDLLGRSLTAIALKANLARRLVGADPPRAAVEIDEVAAAAREALVEVRSAVTGIAGRTMAGEVDHARSMLISAGVQAVIEIDAASLDDRSNAALAMVLREAVTNVVRHARAGRCRIVGQATDGIFQLNVEDDGVGGEIEGFGIAGMRRRMVEIAGNLAIRSDELGTHVHAAVPLRAST